MEKRSWTGNSGVGTLGLSGGVRGDRPGKVSELTVGDRYLDRLVAGLSESGPLGRPLSVAWDAGNGATGDVLSELVRRLPGRHFLLNEKIDGRFPAHHPDPTVEANLRQLQATVIGEKCDLGIAFDGDGDRLGVVDDLAVSCGRISS